MKKKTLTARELRQGKILLRAPVFAVLLLTLLFWLLGGGKGQARPVGKGFDMNLPIAHVKPIVKMDKMGYYEQAERDSAAARQKARMEANYARVLGIDSARSPEAIAHVVQAKLEQVKRVMAGGAVGRTLPVPATRLAPGRPLPIQLNADLAGGSRFPPGANAAGAVAFRPRANFERLEKVMTVLQHDDAGNAELSGLTAVLDKLAVLQSPRRDTVQRRAEQAGRRTEQTAGRPALIVKALPDAEDTLRRFGSARGYDTLHRFDSLRDYDAGRHFDSTAIEAVVPEEQVLVSGGELKLALVRDILLGGLRIPAGTLLYGIASLSGERLRVLINAIAWQGRVFPVELQVDDEDGLAGIYIPGAPLTDAARESVSSEIGAVGPTVVSTGLAGQAANAGMTLARSLIGKKVRPVRVTVPAGYHVLLHSKNEGL